jgi:hypothetical protein
MTRPNIRNRRQRGSAVIEFALVAVLYVPLLVGVVVVGLNLGRNVQIAQFARDAGSMYSRGVDFSEAENKAFLVQMQSFGMTVTGGSGVLILSKFAYIPASSCAGIRPCNSNQQVLLQRIIVGNPSIRSTSFPTGGSVTLDAHGNVADYMTDPNAIVSTLRPRITIADGEFAYTAEAFFSSPDLASFVSNQGVLAVAVF